MSRKFRADGRRLLSCLLFAFLLPLLLTGCAGKRTRLMEGVRTELRGSKFEQAYQTYRESVGDTERVDELLNLGLLALEAGDYAAAHSALAEADRLAEERLTKSLSREAAGLAVSDRVRAYQGTVFDKAMLHYYRAVAFVAQGMPDEAVVEGRRLATYLEVNARESKHHYKDDGFLQWFSGTLYRSYLQDNDAWISFKRARQIYGDYYGIGEPSFLCPVTLEMAQRVGHEESETELAEQCPDAAQSLYPGCGRVVVLCEAGLAPQILEENIVIPIMKNDPDRWDSDDERDAWARSAAARRHDYHYEKKELKYLLRVAMPVYGLDTGTMVYGAQVKGTDGTEVRADLVENVGAVLRQDLNDRYPAILARAIIRGIIKYTATQAAEKAGESENKTLGFILGAVVNAAAVATEAADTRSWETLPDLIYAADFQLQPGEHDLRVLFQDDFGSTLHRYDFPTVTVRAGETVFLRARFTG